MTKSPSEYTKLRQDLLDEARSTLPERSGTGDFTDAQLEHYVLEHMPDAVPLELRLMLRDIEVAEAFRALRLERKR